MEEGDPVRLFTALWPTPEADAALTAALAASPPWHPDGEWRPVPPERRHVTLCFHGLDRIGPRARALDDALAGTPLPRLRLAGLGTFPGVLWAGVRDDPPGALARLAVAAGADPAGFRAHLTLARRARGARGRPEFAEGAALPAGPWWRPGAVLLVRSDLGPAGPDHTPVHRVSPGPSTRRRLGER
ncbi:RNA 2',3'-cyclic phosphodiesterase [Pseudonocardia nematodicida]|uniref:RNA 2',3'-cyclic phosphodiesterase n=1 Tax=Pseudonocardia nematodicida TaxID=1206997 RepID=A0ABV1KM85_9PSEU